MHCCLNWAATHVALDTSKSDSYSKRLRCAQGQDTTLNPCCCATSMADSGESVGQGTRQDCPAVLSRPFKVGAIPETRGDLLFGRALDVLPMRCRLLLLLLLLHADCAQSQPPCMCCTGMPGPCTAFAGESLAHSRFEHAWLVTRAIEQAPSWSGKACRNCSCTPFLV